MYRRVYRASTSSGQRGASYAFLDHDPIRGDHTLVGTLDGGGQDEIGERSRSNCQKLAENPEVGGVAVGDILTILEYYRFFWFNLKALKGEQGRPEGKAGRWTRLRFGTD